MDAIKMELPSELKNIITETISTALNSVIKTTAQLALD